VVVTTFALVHGAWHGAWCFDALAAELRRRGHTAVAVDLPVDAPDAGAERYAEVVADGLRGFAGPPVLVGHSMGGLVLPLLPALLPVRRLVLLCALLPRPGHAFLDGPGKTAPAPVAGLLLDELRRSRWTPDGAVRVLYGGVDPDVARVAAARLRPQAELPFTETTPLRAWPEVPTTSVYGVDDTVVPPALFVPAARELLGVEPVLVPGHHFAILSSAAAVAGLLDELA
jgi:pimeloyl-ACP methyl ester carboxylesterase